MMKFSYGNCTVMQEGGRTAHFRFGESISDSEGLTQAYALSNVYQIYGKRKLSKSFLYQS